MDPMAEEIADAAKNRDEADAESDDEDDVHNDENWASSTGA